MILGILAYPVRFAVWAFFAQNPALIVLVQILHGVCYAFFFAAVYIFAEEYFPKDVRASAQGLFNVMILGVGVLVANSICPKLAQETFFRNGATDFHHLFLVPLTVALVSAAALALFFRPPQNRETGPVGRTNGAV
jgi:MFS family permease